MPICSRRVSAFRLCLIAALALSALIVRAESPPARSPHAWVVIDDPVEFAPRGGRGAEADGAEEPESEAAPASPASVLLHLPPRVPVAGASPAPDLRVARVARLAVAPQWLVPVGDTMYAIMPADEQGIHRVGRSRVHARGLRDLWAASPVRRLEVLPALNAPVLGATTDGTSPIVLTREQRVAQALRFESEQWSPMAPPFEIGSNEVLGVAWWRDGPAVLTAEAEGPAWTRFDGEAWVRSAAIVPDGLGAETPRVVGDWQGELIALAGAPGGPSRVLSLAPDAARVIGSVPAGDWSAAAILAHPGRLVLVATAAEATEDAQTALPSPGLKQRAVTVAEFSLVTGTMLAFGEATASSPVSRGEFQSLAMLLVAAMLLVLVVVVRPSPAAAEPVLPPGTAIAPSGRRLVASIADLVPSLVVTSMLLDITLLKALGPIALPVTGSIDIVPLVVALAITALHSALGEMLTGRSLGKMLTGIFVARIDPVPGVAPEAGRFRPPTPGGAVLRNIVKWFLFPATAMVLSDPSGRHRGDLIAKCAVLCPVSPAD